MKVAAATFPKAFAIRFKDLRLWSVGSFVRSGWQWPEEYIQPLSAVLCRRIEEVNRRQCSIEDLLLVTLHFDGTMEPRRNRGNQKDFKGRLFFAFASDIVYSKIDVRNGAIGIVPPEIDRVAVSSEYPVYKVSLDTALPAYIKLLFRTSYFRRALNSMISGASGRKRVQPEQIEAIKVPLPPLPIQQAIVERWEKAEAEILAAETTLQKIRDSLNAVLYEHYDAHCKKDILKSRWLVVRWAEMSRWDVKTARASAFRVANSSFIPLGEFAEEATELVRPWEEPEKEWPVYGVNNKQGVFFSHYQKGKDFNAPYKRICKDGFFHNPTRSSVGSLGIVPDVPDDAITSPEYQVWKIRQGLIPGYVAVLISTPFFVNLIQFHRVGAVKQRLYVENLLEICVPVLPIEEQGKIAQARETALRHIARVEEKVAGVKREVEEMILGIRPVPGTIGLQKANA